jgi:hypothetical protein
MQNYEKEIITAMQDSKELLFYKVMHYPVPKKYQQFMTKKVEYQEKNKLDSFSRKGECKQLAEYHSHIEKYSKLLQNLPFVKELYICNSFSFNALKEESDIDLFIITKKGALRRARFFSVVLLFLS